MIEALEEEANQVVVGMCSGYNPITLFARISVLSFHPFAFPLGGSKGPF